MLLLPVIATAQTTATGLPAVTTLIKRQSLINSMNALALNIGSETKNYSAKQQMQYALKYSKANPKDKTSTLIKKYLPQLTSYTNDLDDFGDSQATLYFSSYNETPIDFASNLNGLTFVQNGLIYHKALNTYNSEPNERAQRVAEAVLLPALSKFEPLLKITEIKFFCLTAGFLTKDFTDDSSVSGNGETIAIVISRTTLQKYINAQMTDQEVFKLASFYSQNKNTVGNIKKIQLK